MNLWVLFVSSELLKVSKFLNDTDLEDMLPKCCSHLDPMLTYHQE